MQISANGQSFHHYNLVVTEWLDAQRELTNLDIGTKIFPVFVRYLKINARLMETTTKQCL